MPYTLNKKNFAVTRLFPKGPNGNKRLNYMHVSRKGTTVANGQMVARVALPPDAGEQPQTPYIYPRSVVTKAMPEGENENVLMSGELPASTTAEHSVPNYDMMIPKPEHQVAAFTCDAEELLILLKTVMDVTEDADNCIRLRICNSPGIGSTLRIDSVAFPGKQAFLGVLKGMQYDGEYVAGEAESTKVGVKMQSDETIKKSPLPLVLSEGRKFRG